MLFDVAKDLAHLFYQVRPQYGTQEIGKNEETAQHVAWPSCAWLLLSFFPFPVGHPVAHRCLMTTKDNGGKVSARLQPATVGNARLVLSKPVPFFCTSLYNLKDHPVPQFEYVALRQRQEDREAPRDHEHPIRSR